MKNRKPLEIIFPVLFGVYPLLALFSVNNNYVKLGDISRSIFLALLGMGLAWLLFWWIFKSWIKAGVLVSLAAILFFSYGHIYLLALDYFGEGFSHKILVPIYLVVGLLVSILVISKIKEQSSVLAILGIVGAVLVGMTLFQIGWYQYQVWQESLDDIIENPLNEQVSKNLPDIYLIILDAHTRSDVLLEDYDLDNSEFILTLEEIGFYVAGCSQSNYPITDLALQSLFNMDYVHQFIGEGDVLPDLNSSTVKKTLSGAGYTTFSFNNYFSSHYNLGEDERIERKASITERVNLFTGLNEYESLVIETSILRLLVDFQYLLRDHFGEKFSDEEKYYSHYLETLFILDELKNLPLRPEKKFVFAHLAVPHWPFVFSEDGEYEHIWGLSDDEGYRKNVVFIDQQIPEVIRQIISGSDIPPVIILMGDHGPTGEGVPIENRISNLYGVYADEEILKHLYPTITPVNTFRLIFNQYFSTDYDLLEDVSYKIWNNDAYNLESIISNSCVVD